MAIGDLADQVAADYSCQVSLVRFLFKNPRAGKWAIRNEFGLELERYKFENIKMIYKYFNEGTKPPNWLIKKLPSYTDLYENGRYKEVWDIYSPLASNESGDVSKSSKILDQNFGEIWFKPDKIYKEAKELTLIQFKLENLRRGDLRLDKKFEITKLKKLGSSVVENTRRMVLNSFYNCFSYPKGYHYKLPHTEVKAYRIITKREIDGLKDNRRKIKYGIERLEQKMDSRSRSIRHHIERNRELAIVRGELKFNGPFGTYYSRRRTGKSKRMEMKDQRERLIRIRNNLIDSNSPNNLEKIKKQVKYSQDKELSLKYRYYMNGDPLMDYMIATREVEKACKDFKDRVGKFKKKERKLSNPIDTRGLTQVQIERLMRKEQDKKRKEEARNERWAMLPRIAAEEQRILTEEEKKERKKEKKRLKEERRQQNKKIREELEREGF